MWRTVDNRRDRTPVEDFIVGCTRDKYDKELIAPEDERDYPTLFIIPSQLERRLSIQKKEIGTKTAIIAITSKNYLFR